jgi:hypothetical protein
MNKEKLCKDCNKTKPLTDFRQTAFWTCKKKIKRGITIRGRCKECELTRVRKRYHENDEVRKRVIEHSKKYHEANRDKVVKRRRIHYDQNRERLLKQKRDEYREDPEKMRERNREGYARHSEERAATKRRQRKEDPELFKAIQKKSYLKHRERILAKDKIYKSKHIERYKKQANEKYKNNLQFNLRSKLKNRINWVMRYGVKKSEQTMHLLGTDDLSVVWKHLEQTWTKTYNTEVPKDEFFNGNIHIDHILPCASFDLTDPSEQKKCFHFTNLQLLWAEDNLRKGDRF